VFPNPVSPLYMEARNRQEFRFHLHREHVAGYSFLFTAPWAWLIDHLWLENNLDRVLGPMAGYVVTLWIPAALYAGCLWLLFFCVRVASANRHRYRLINANGTVSDNTSQTLTATGAKAFCDGITPRLTD
jgi:hypothetical protein